MSHDDNRRRLAGKFKEEHRFSNFGPVVERMTITGFRGVDNLTVEFGSPVVAISGLNGTGKSTVVQLMASAYRSLGDGFPPRAYIPSWFPVSVVDPRPFTDEARVQYEYADETGSQRLTVSRAATKWSGYKRQPARASYYAGLTHFVPKIEKRDFSVYGGAQLEFLSETPLSDVARNKFNHIMGTHYDEASFAAIRLSGRNGQLAIVKRDTRRYSENHMGFGEGRIFYIVDLLEHAPKQSLILLEEPETALHGEAQRRLGEYLIDVSYRRHHQIVLTTHSGALMSQLGRDSILLLRRGADGSLSATPGLSTYQIDSYLDKATTEAVTLCVEDAFASALLTEILRARDPDLLTGAGIFVAGDVTSLVRAVPVLRGAGKRAVGISDTDQTHAGEGGVFAMPGSQTPEETIFRDSSVEELFSDRYAISTRDLLAGADDHHLYPKILANAVGLPIEAIQAEACRVWVENCDEGFFDDVVEFIRSQTRDHR